MNEQSTVGGLDIGGHFARDGVADILHDLKSPLSAIALAASVLDERIARGDRCGAAREADRISRNVAFMDRMVLDLMDVCALAHAPLDLYREPTDLRALIADVLDRVVSDRDRDRVHFDAPAPQHLRVDAYRIERVVANLVDNALRYARTSDVLVSLHGFEQCARVSVVDAGPGMTADESERVFDQFVRGSASHGRIGSGLGLYISRRIIEAHGGRVGVESARGIGSRFYFELPVT